MEGSNGQPGLGAWSPATALNGAQIVQRIDDGHKQADTFVTPTGGVKRDREFAIASGVDRGDVVDERLHRWSALEPALGGLCDRLTNATAAMPQ